MNKDDVYNPFKDAELRTIPALPEIYDEGSQNVMRTNGQTVLTNAIDDYSPFSVDETEDTPEIHVSGQAVMATINFQEWQNDLDAREKRLSEEEQRQRVREVELNVKINNFPPFPACCRLKPCFYQAIDIEIPEQCRRIVKFGYLLWICYCSALLLNVIGATVVLIVFAGKPGYSSNVPSLFGVSIVLLVLFVPLSYLLWFRRLYIAFKTNSSLQFFIFFFMFTLCLVSLVVEVIGIPQCGVCGWVLVFLTKDNIGVMCFMIVIACVFTLITAASFYLLLKVNMYFRSSGGSFSKAKGELATNASSSETVRSVALGREISTRY